MKAVHEVQEHLNVLKERTRKLKECL